MTTPIVPLKSRVAPLLAVDGLAFKDLNKNGQLDPYEDWRLPIETRVADLISRMTVEEKVGIMHYASNHFAYTGPEGEILDEPKASPMGRRGRGPFKPRFEGHLGPAPQHPPREMVLERHMRFVNNFGGTELSPAARGHAGTTPCKSWPRARAWASPWSLAPTRAMPTRALALPSGRRSSVRPPPAMQAWCASWRALANQQQRAVGVRYHIAPMADVATEPRWPRIPGTFGEDAAASAPS